MQYFLQIFIWRYPARGTCLQNTLMHTTQRLLLYQTVSTVVGPHERLIKPEQAARLPGRPRCTAQGGTSYRKFANPPLYGPPKPMLGSQL